MVCQLVGQVGILRFFHCNYECVFLLVSILSTIHARSQEGRVLRQRERILLICLFYDLHFNRCKTYGTQNSVFPKNIIHRNSRTMLHMSHSWPSHSPAHAPRRNWKLEGYNSLKTPYHCLFGVFVIWMMSNRWCNELVPEISAMKLVGTCMMKINYRCLHGISWFKVDRVVCPWAYTCVEMVVNQFHW